MCVYRSRTAEEHSSDLSVCLSVSLFCVFFISYCLVHVTSDSSFLPHTVQQHLVAMVTVWTVSPTLDGTAIPPKVSPPFFTAHFLWYAHCMIIGMMTTQRLVRELQLAVLVDVAVLC